MQFLRLNWWRFLIGGALWSVFYTAMVREVFELSWSKSLTESLSVNAVLLVSIFVAVNGLRYYQPSYDRAMFLITAAGVLSALVVVVDQYFIGVLFQAEDESFLEKSLYLHGGVAFLANAAAIGLSMQRSQLLEQQDLEQRSNETERMAKEAELLRLRHQLQPHFLFNSLNSINALIHSKPGQAREMVNQLSAFLRGTIKTDDQQSIPLQDELEHINLYLEIEKVRFGHRLETTFEIHSDAEQGTLPPLLLQPLMENAIKFGLYGTTGEVCIQLKATLRDRMLVLSIVNPIDADVESQSGTGFGLNSIRRRLQLLYGRNDLLQTHSGVDTFTATLKIPQTA